MISENARCHPATALNQGSRSKEKPAMNDLLNNLPPLSQMLKLIVFLILALIVIALLMAIVRALVPLLIVAALVAGGVYLYRRLQAHGPAS
jgi:uncharacterized membrane protein